MAIFSYPNLLKPGRIGGMNLRNRMIVTAMGVNFGEDEGSSGERVLHYHEEQAKGGVALIISGACGVAYPVGQVQPRQVAISDDRYIPGLKRVVDAVHRHGAKFAVQLHPLRLRPPLARHDSARAARGGESRVRPSRGGPGRHSASDSRRSARFRVPPADRSEVSRPWTQLRRLLVPWWS